jgi:hypothetical protein
MPLAFKIALSSALAYCVMRCLESWFGWDLNGARLSSAVAFLFAVLAGVSIMVGIWQL